MNLRDQRKVEEVWNLLNEEKALMIMSDHEGTAMKAFNKNFSRT